MTIRKTISEGQIIPRFYGKAFFNYMTYEAICYPIPMNFIVGWARTLLCILKMGTRKNFFDRKLIEARSAGHVDGVELGKFLARKEFRLEKIGSGKDEIEFYFKDK